LRIKENERDKYRNNFLSVGNKRWIGEYLKVRLMCVISALKAGCYKKVSGGLTRLKMTDRFYLRTYTCAQNPKNLCEWKTLFRARSQTQGRI